MPIDLLNNKKLDKLATPTLVSLLAAGAIAAAYSANHLYGNSVRELATVEQTAQLEQGMDRVTAIIFDQIESSGLGPKCTESDDKCIISGDSNDGKLAQVMMTGQTISLAAQYVDQTGEQQSLAIGYYTAERLEPNEKLSLEDLKIKIAEGRAAFVNESTGSGKEYWFGEKPGEITQGSPNGKNEAYSDDIGLTIKGIEVFVDQY